MSSVRHCEDLLALCSLSEVTTDEQQHDFAGTEWHTDPLGFGWFGLAGGVQVPSNVEIANIRDDGWNFTVSAAVEFDFSSMQYEIVSLAVEADRKDDRPQPVTAGLLRSVPIKRIEEMIFTGNFPMRADKDWIAQVSEVSVDSLATLASRAAGAGPTPEALEVAAVIYCTFFALRGNPTQMISRLMGIPHRTASNWVKLARERGYLSSDPTKSIDGPTSVVPNFAQDSAFGALYDASPKSE